ncbi:Os04g0259150, partial [Oryza sativa Japonica Group]
IASTVSPHRPAAGNIRFYQQLAVLASLISSAHRWEIGSRHCSMSLSPSSYRPRQRYIVPTRHQTKQLLCSFA